MAKPQKTRPIRFDQFKQQLDEVGIKELEVVELNGDGDRIYLRLGVGIDVEETQEFMEKVQGCETEKEAVLEILGHHPTISAEEQYELFHENNPHEEADAQLIALWGAATGDMRDRMGKLRPKRS